MESETGRVPDGTTLETTGTGTDEITGRSAGQIYGGLSGTASSGPTGTGSDGSIRTGSLSTYMSLLRPLNAVMAGVGVFVGGIVAVGMDITGQDVLLRVILAYLAAFFATGAGNALNDLVDAETDKVNHPERPIPSGNLTPLQVKRVVYLGYSLTLLLAAFVNKLNLIIAIFNVSMMIGYELRLKKKGFVGNLAISYLTGSVFLFGGSATLENEALIDMIMSSEFGVTVILALLAFLASVGREIIKDVQDMEGDIDRFTLPMRIGKERAVYIACFMILVAVALSWLPYYFEILGSIYLGLVSVADALFIYTVVLAFMDPGQSQKMAKFAMLAALVAFLAGGIS